MTTDWTTETKGIGAYAELNGINLYYFRGGHPRLPGRAAIELRRHAAPRERHVKLATKGRRPDLHDQIRRHYDQLWGADRIEEVHWTPEPIPSRLPQWHIAKIACGPSPGRGPGRWHEVGSRPWERRSSAAGRSSGSCTS